MKTNKGFTLNEILIAIAILGILLAIVYVSLTSSRDRAADKAIQSNLSGIIGISSIIYSQNNTYGDFCTNPKVVAQIELAKKAAGITTPTITNLSTPGSSTQAACHINNDDIWAISVPLKSNPSNSYCVDSKGTLIELITSLSAVATPSDNGHLKINQVSCSN